MINTLEDLKKYSLKVAETYPEDAESILISSPGISEVEVRLLTEIFSNISNVYLDCIKELNLSGIEVGSFSLYPEAYKGETIIEKLRDAFSTKNPHYSFLQNNNLIQVGFWDVDPILVANSNSNFGSDKVFTLDHDNPDQSPYELANNFKDFLLIIGNLDEIAFDQEQEGQDLVNEFMRRLSYFIENAEGNERWRVIAEITLLD